MTDGRNLTGDEGEGGRVGEKKTQQTGVGREEEEKDDDDGFNDNNNDNDGRMRLVSQLILN